jgi:hypothetical protein
MYIKNINLICMIIYMIKYKLFKLIHDYPVEIYLMWIIVIFTAFAIISHMYCKSADITETFQFVQDL